MSDLIERLTAVADNLNDEEAGYLFPHETATIREAVAALKASEESRLRLEKASAIITAYGDENEATAYPFWYIAQKTGLGCYGMLRGIWFSREAAENHLKNKAHRYSKTAFVYCDSGHDSMQLRALYDSLRPQKENPV